MSFAAREVSADLGSPIRLYLFRYGAPAGAVIAYTDFERAIDFDNGELDEDDDPIGPVTYQPIAIEQDEIKADGKLTRNSTEIRTSDDTALADLFRLYPPSRVVTVAVYAGHDGDPDEQFLLDYSGRVVGFSTDLDDVAHFTCEPISTSMARAGLRRRWQFGCPHVLYSQGPRKCNANKAAATETHIVLGVDGALIGLAEDWSDRREKFEGGLAEWTLDSGVKEVRTIIRCDEDGTVVLSGAATGLDSGDGVDLVLGCNHKSGVGPQPDGDCLALHDNVLNFGGQMFIPTKNPVGLVNNYW
jgi:hypothetical protein